MARLLSGLERGEPPLDSDLLAAMTVGRDLWLDRYRANILETLLPEPPEGAGSSKVKVLVGPEGCGKSHLLRCAAQDAVDLGYQVAHLSARDIGHRLNDIRGLYRTVAARLDLERLVDGLCRKVVDGLGYRDIYGGYGALVPLLEERGIPPEDARRDIREEIGKAFRNTDLLPGFAAFASRVVRARLIQGRTELAALYLKWLKGAKLERSEKTQTGQFDVLQKSTARAWLTSLSNLLRLGGARGLVVVIDDLDILIETDPITSKPAYSKAQAQDTLELIRQLIDEAEVLPHFALLLAARPDVVENMSRGFKGYEALWMRLQTGLVASPRFNALADLVDVARHLDSMGPKLPSTVSDRLAEALHQSGFGQRPRPGSWGSAAWPLRQAVVETAALVSAEEEDFVS
ncbi:MAG: DUF2791 family P-loop domain-containing protein [Candidatus Sericytochromatia bacterium]|nr:DUF2791 family P-loop domain-containing protein [Candidatus Tanganyikabacteria bacterium]